MLLVIQKLLNNFLRKKLKIERNIFDNKSFLMKIFKTQTVNNENTYLNLTELLQFTWMVVAIIITAVKIIGKKSVTNLSQYMLVGRLHNQLKTAFPFALVFQRLHLIFFYKIKYTICDLTEASKKKIVKKAVLLLFLFFWLIWSFCCHSANSSLILDFHFCFFEGTVLTKELAEEVENN